MIAALLLFVLPRAAFASAEATDTLRAECAALPARAQTQALPEDAATGPIARWTALAPDEVWEFLREQGNRFPFPTESRRAHTQAALAQDAPAFERRLLALSTDAATAADRELAQEFWQHWFEARPAHDFAERLHWLDQIESPPVRWLAAEALLHRQRNARHIAALAEWLAAADLGDASTHALVRSTARAQARVGTGPAFVWADGLPPGDAQRIALIEVFRVSGETFPLLGLGWFEKSKDRLRYRNELGEALIDAFARGLLQGQHESRVYDRLSEVSDEWFGPRLRTEFLRQAKLKNPELAHALEPLLSPR